MSRVKTVGAAILVVLVLVAVAALGTGWLWSAVRLVREDEPLWAALALVGGLCFYGAVVGALRQVRQGYRGD